MSFIHMNDIRLICQHEKQGFIFMILRNLFSIRSIMRIFDPSARLSFFLIHSVNTIMAEIGRSMRQMPNEVGRFIKDHHHEPGFSFSIAPSVRENVTFPGLIHQKKPDKTWNLAEVLYPQYYRTQDPAYCSDGHNWIIITIRPDQRVICMTEICAH